VTATPLPGALILFLSGLLGFGALIDTRAGLPHRTWPLPDRSNNIRNIKGRREAVFLSGLQSSDARAELNVAVVVYLFFAPNEGVKIPPGNSHLLGEGSAFDAQAFSRGNDFGFGAGTRVLVWEGGRTRASNSSDACGTCRPSWPGRSSHTGISVKPAVACVPANTSIFGHSARGSIRMAV
jgi:hypothetical protein